jgi:parallel beta-helix repeat protein
VVIEKTIRLIGDGSQNTTIDGQNARPCVTLHADHVSIIGFTIRRSNVDGIRIIDSYGSSIRDSYIRNNVFSFFGILLQRSSHTTIAKNIIANNRRGVSLQNSSNNTITWNIIRENNNVGMLLQNSNDNIITRNSIIYNHGTVFLVCGIDFRNSSTNIVTENNISYNNVGFYMREKSNGNMIYHNDVINNEGGNAFIEDGCYNVWYEEFPVGGNYWSGYLGNDTNGDGFGDEPYIVDHSDDLDWYPLMHPLFVRYFSSPVDGEEL